MLSVTGRYQPCKNIKSAEMVERDRQRYKRKEEEPVIWIARAFTPQALFRKTRKSCDLAQKKNDPEKLDEQLNFLVDVASGRDEL